MTSQLGVEVRLPINVGEVFENPRSGKRWKVIEAPLFGRVNLMRVDAAHFLTMQTKVVREEWVKMAT